ncbi:MAG: phytoene/squalene synthase family protein, partial [Candidatus Eutrophobiaceae bacterium]
MERVFAEFDDEAYQVRILQDVSRTFALTIPQLPPQLARVVGNAYLLCRIADTIEDDRKLSTDTKRSYAQLFDTVVKGAASSERFAADLSAELSTQTPAAEIDLINHTPAVIRITHSLSVRQRQILERCVHTMTKGMAHYQTHQSGNSIASLADMGGYCYHVAGVVGEMLTELFCDHLNADESLTRQLNALAASFGQALQMTNILKDIWEDRQRDACWLPKAVFMRQGIDISKGVSLDACGSPAWNSAMGELIAHTHGHLCNALAYTLLLPREAEGIRRFCLWALGMAVLTLNKINMRRDFTCGTQVKINRRSVKLVYVLSKIFCRHNT